MDRKQQIIENILNRRYEEAMADTNDERLEGHGEHQELEKPRESSDVFAEASWPARPGRKQHEWEEPRVVKTESELGGADDGTRCRVDPTTNRVDRLRLLGNGVVPETAERAIRILLERLHQD